MRGVDSMPTFEVSPVTVDGHNFPGQDQGQIQS